MNGEDVSLFRLFREEVRAHTDTLSSGLVELEADAGNPQRIEPLMRAAHSLKGAARIMNIDAAVRVAHAMEDALVAAQEGRVRLGPEDIDALLQGADLLATLGQMNEDAVPAWAAAHQERVEHLAQAYRRIQQGLGAPAVAAPGGAQRLAAENKNPLTPDPSPARGGGGKTEDPSPARGEGKGTENASHAPTPTIVIPTESLLSGDHCSMFDLFREELRVNALALRDGLQRAGQSPPGPADLDALAEAAHTVQGAARLVNLEPAVTLAQGMNRIFVSAKQKTQGLGTAEVGLCGRALALLVGVLQVEEEAAAGWAEGRAAEVGRLREELEGVNVAAGGRGHAVPDATPVAEVSPPSPPAPLPQKGARGEVGTPSPPAPLPLEGAGAEDETQSPPTPLPLDERKPQQMTPLPQQGTGESGVTEEAVVRVTAQSLNRLMSLAGESLVQARWLAPFSTALLKLKKHQDHLSALLSAVSQALTSDERHDQLPGLVAEARRLAERCRQLLLERTGEFDEHAAQAEDLNSRLYREVIGSRMRPFADGAHGFPRLVRDMARSLGRKVRLEIEGTATPVDRDILEKLEAPLNHLLRNAVDHAIESPERRLAAGKPETGLIRVEARHRAGALAITVSDDGKGIDLEALRRKVVERGLTTAAMAGSLSEAELLEFLFLPGFSTAGAVTEFSGRGVGLDVVLTTARQVGGSARVTTRAGRGTTFHLQLPITLSVLRAVLVDIAGEVYAFPHNRIERILRVARADLASLENRQFLLIDGQNIGLVLAAQILELPATPPAGDEVCVVLLGDGTGAYGLIVDSFRGEQDLVVRPLDARLGKVPNLSAAATLDDGAPVLIVDVEDLFRSMDQYIQNRTLQRCERAAKAERPRKRVLVVDDSITVREVERQLLRHRGYEVALAVDGQDGWNAVRSEAFDLMISDVDMPRMNGFELVRAVRGDPALRGLPVIIVSYKDREEDRLRGLEVGANYYLTKSSFHDETFLRAVADLIGEA